MNSLQKNTTWELVSLPLGRKLLQCKWVFWTKVSTNGINWKYKAILVEKIFSQFQGVDYHETFAPVSKMDSIRLVLAISASKHWEVHHMDVKSTFLHGDIHEESWGLHLWSIFGLQAKEVTICVNPKNPSLSSTWPKTPKDTHKKLLYHSIRPPHPQKDFIFKKRAKKPKKGA